MGEQGPQKKEKPEPAVLGEISLGFLAKELSETPIQFGMLLNIPTLSISLKKEKTSGDDYELAKELVLQWKVMRATAKDRDKIAEMDRVLRELNKHDAADVWLERHRNNQELTADAFQ